MKKLYLNLILALVLLSVAGCTSGYRVYVNGFSELDQPIEQDSSIFVVAEPNSSNPIMDNRIKARIKQLLEWDGYRPADAGDQFDYKLTFESGLDTRQTWEYRPFFHQYVGFHGGYYRGYHFGYTTYYPYSQTYQTQWLVIRLIAPTPPADSDAEKVIWVGEAVTNTGGQDSRVVIDYLLVGCLEYLGIETGRQISLIITQDDPRITMIESHR